MLLWQYNLERENKSQLRFFFDLRSKAIGVIIILQSRWLWQLSFYDESRTPYTAFYGDDSQKSHLLFFIPNKQ